MYETAERTELMLDYQSVDMKIGADLAIVGHADVKKILEEIEAIVDKYREEYNENYTLENYAKEIVAVVNKHAKLYLISTKENHKIADVEMGYSKEENCWNGYCDTYYSPDLLLVFSDKTKISAEVFFGSGFNKVVDAWMDFLARFE